MATSKIIYKGGLTTEATHLLSGKVVITDAPLDNNGKGQAFSPTDLTATSLGSCMMTLMAMAADKDQINLEGTQIEITKIMGTNPRRIVEIQVVFDFPENLVLTEEQQQVLSNAAINCPVAKSLHPDIIQQVRFNFA